MNQKTIFPKWLVVLRILLGILLFMKGIQFIYDNTLIQEVFQKQTFLQENKWLQTIIPWVHLLGGVFITIGMFVRLAVVTQLPIIVGAIVFSVQNDFSTTYDTTLAYAFFLLALLLIFLFVGNGPVSWKKMIDKEHGKIA